MSQRARLGAGGIESLPPEVQPLCEEALAIIRALGFPKPQQNVRSALTLMALAAMRPGLSWQAASNPPMGIRSILDVMRTTYERPYAENSRETVRRQTIHQFWEAHLILKNPDNPKRPPNSGDTVYQLDADALNLLRSFGTVEWESTLAVYLSTRDTLAERYARLRDLERIPVVFNDGVTVSLTPGGQNVLVRDIIEEFCPRFTPGASVLYIGDTGGPGGKSLYHDAAALAALDVRLDVHGKLPDVIVYDAARNWLVLIEAVTSHGPVDGKRHDELAHLFSGSAAGLVFVTAFLSRKALREYVHLIDWETEVWTADAKDHLIHFNGDRFFGPHERNRED